MTKKPFKVSTYLKDIIGRDLVTNSSVAIFELVKNSIDAGASRVQMEFDLKNDSLMIIDDGKGMSALDIQDKWLFVAYSAKLDGSEDTEDYRDKIRTSGSYAGNKGIGRFSCDTLGASLSLFSRSDEDGSSVNRLSVNWKAFEKDSQKEFHTVLTDLSKSQQFPTPTLAKQPVGTGTLLLIKGLRQHWDEGDVRDLRKYLAKLIDPFGTTSDVEVATFVVGSDVADETLNGHVFNDISDVLRDKTAKIAVQIANGNITSTLTDRGKLIYKITEENEYLSLDSSIVSGEIYWLNRSAKQTFSVRMKVAAVQFGNIFLFLNGFRIFPIGEETREQARF